MMEEVGKLADYFLYKYGLERIAKRRPYFPPAEMIRHDRWTWRPVRWRDLHADLYYARANREIVVVHRVPDAVAIVCFELREEKYDITRRWWFYKRMLQDFGRQNHDSNGMRLGTQQELEELIEQNISLFSQLPVICTINQKVQRIM